MTPVPHTLVHNGEYANITAFAPGHHRPFVAHSSHPNFDAIIDAIAAGDADALPDLFDVSRPIEVKFAALTDTVSVAHGRVYHNGNPVDGSVADHIVRFYDEGVEDWQPLVRFLERVEANPNEHSRQQLYDWLKARRFSITPVGNIVFYKGVTRNEEGEFVSVNSGAHCSVNGERVPYGRVPNPVGAVVEMARSYVAHDPSQGCSTGLHVATRGYARSWGAGGAVLEVHVNPRDVVSVPTEAGGCDKVRVCRYVIAGISDEAHEDLIVDDYDIEDCEYCGGIEGYCSCDDDDERDNTSWPNEDLTAC